MGLIQRIIKLLDGGATYPAGAGLGLGELARRLGMTALELQGVEVGYHHFDVPKRGGGVRRISAPLPELRAVQDRILHRLLRGLRAHPAAMGFERGRSIVLNAAAHSGRAVVVKLDVRDFFASTTRDRVYDYFRRIGWGEEAAQWLAKVMTHDGGLPQGAPTSPRLSNLVNYGLDARLCAVARGAAYTRYADDLTFSFETDDRWTIKSVIRATKDVLADYGYRLHLKKKLHIRRRYEQQRVTGLVVNEKVQLPRPIRRWLRAVEHRIAMGKPGTLTEAQLAGWRGLREMVERQATGAKPDGDPGP